MQNDDLMPCPFCGGEAVEATSKAPTGERYRWVQCTDCGAMTECCDDSARSNNPDEPEPVDLWNTRTAHSGEGRSNGAGEDRLREALGDQIADAVEGRIATEFKGFWAREDLVDEIPGMIREAARAALKQQPD